MIQNNSSNQTDWSAISGKISKIYGEWHTPSCENAVNRRIPHTALLGNGDIGLSSAGNAMEKTFHTSKSDFWSINKMNGFGNQPLTVITIGGLTLRNAQHTTENTDPYYEKQDILRAVVTTEQTLGDAPLTMETWVSAVNNIAVMSITSHADHNTSLEYTVWTKSDNSNLPASAYAEKDTATAKRRTWNALPEREDSWTSEAVVSAKIIGTSAQAAADCQNGKATLLFTLAPEQTVYAVAAFGGGGRTYNNKGELQQEDPFSESRKLLDSVVSEQDVLELYQKHLAWWKQYWSASYIDITSDNENEALPILERYYYGAQYIIGSAAREGKTAPGLYGIWHTTDYPQWSSDYHLNYNFIAPFYAVCSSNRPQLQLPASEALLNQIPTGVRNAENTEELRKILPAEFDFIDNKIAEGKIDAVNGIPGGMLFSVGVGPWGFETEPSTYLRETMDAAYSVYPLCQYYDYTGDETFLADILYPYLKKCAVFFENWIGTKEDPYTLYAGYNEGSWSKNPAVELAAYRNVMERIIRYSEKLKLDDDKRENWKTILCNLAPQPRGVFNGKLVYSLAEKDWNGSEWKDFADLSGCGGNILPLDSVIPGNTLGFFSAENELEIARSTIDVLGDIVWTCPNNFPRVFPDAIRCRYPAKDIVEKFSQRIETELQKNLLISDSVHGIEKCGSAETINSMLIQQHLGVTKLFPNWLPDANAQFDCLRVPGAFVVSAGYNKDSRHVEEGVKVTSLIGGTFTLVNPWNQDAFVCLEDGTAIPYTTGTAPNHPEDKTICFQTTAGKTYLITLSKK